MEERRKYPRLKREWEMTYRVLAPGPENTLHRARTMDISQGGIRFRTKQELKLGTPIVAELNSSEFPSPIVGFAKVVRCIQSIQTAWSYEVGVAFWWCSWKDNDAQEAIGDYVGKVLKEKES